MDRKGQTAFEYLLIVVLVIAVVVIMVVWNQSFSEGLDNTTMGQAGDVICVTTECGGDDECNIPACGGSGICISGLCQKL